MSEDSIHRTTLVPRATGQLAQVLTAGRQLGIAAQLKDDIDRDRLVALLKRIPSEKAIWWLSRSQPLSADMIERFEKWWNWAELSGNKSLPWSLELIERFEEHWDWSDLSENEGLPWSLELIERFEKRWGGENFYWGGLHWGGLTWNKSLPWSLELIERFEERWFWGEEKSWYSDKMDSDDWEWIDDKKGRSGSYTLLRRFEERGDWGGISGNEDLPWSLELIERFEEQWDWAGLSGNEGLPWSLELIERFEGQWDAGM